MLIVLSFHGSIRVLIVNNILYAFVGNADSSFSFFSFNFFYWFLFSIPLLVPIVISGSIGNSPEVLNIYSYVVYLL